jgi:ribosomal protein S18 acetylase RimI-like enzyme
VDFAAFDIDMRPASVENLDDFLLYLEDHLADNGAPGHTLFLPSPPGEPWPRAEKRRELANAFQIPVGEAGWRRAWTACSGPGHVIGHVDLRARPELHTSHRALLGMGVHRNHRRKGLGRTLLTFVCEWAAAQSLLEWIDLDVLEGNGAARDLYLSSGFVEVGRIPDLFRIQGHSVGAIQMARRIRSVGRQHESGLL